MLKDIPYSVLKNDKRTYEIMLLRDRSGSSFTDIAKTFSLSPPRVRQLYNQLKIKQTRLYINRISLVLGHDDISQVEKVYEQAYNCYQDRSYACAYLEKKYRSILTEYRDGEPGIPAKFLRSLPPLKTEFTEQEIKRIIEMREAENALFTEIAKEFGITREKAKHIYDWHYHRQSVAPCKGLNIAGRKPAGTNGHMGSLLPKQFHAQKAL